MGAKARRRAATGIAQRVLVADRTTTMLFPCGVSEPGALGRMAPLQYRAVRRRKVAPTQPDMADVR
jgi:hypothetical protein